MMTSFDPHKNFAVSTVNTAPSPANSGITLTLNTGDGVLFPQPGTDGPFNITVWPALVQPSKSNAEICRVTARTGDVLTIARAQESSSARSILVGDQIALTVTNKILTDIENEINTIANGGSLSALGWFSVKDAAYGAKGDGVTDDTTAISAAITAAAIKGGIVFFPPGNYLISSKISVPGGVMLWGSGGNGGLPYAANITPATRITCTAAAAQIAYGDRTTNYRYGWQGGFLVDGNSVATQPLYFGFVVESLFEDIQAVQSAGIGALVEAAQNCRFINFAAINNSGAGLVLDYGAQECSFLAEIRGNGSDGTGNVLIRQSGASPSGAGTTPTHNIFVSGSVIEQPNASATYVLAQTNGHLNVIDCTMADTGIAAPRDLIQVTRSDTSKPSDKLTLRTGANLHGTASQTTFIDVAGSVGHGSDVVVDGFIFIENALNVFKCDSNSSIYLAAMTQQPVLSSGITNWAADSTTRGRFKYPMASSSATVAAPSGTASTTAVMAGLAAAITPQITGRVFIIIEGHAQSTVIGDGVKMQPAYGTGAAPNNGDAATGTTVGLLQNYIASTTAGKAPFSVSGLVTGLVVGTAYWVDLQFAAITGGTGTLANVVVTVIEL